MTDAVIVSTARTALAKSWKGAFNMTHGATMGGHALSHAIQRAGIEPGEVEDVLIGCATPEGATGSNIARQIAIRGGCFCNPAIESITKTDGLTYKVSEIVERVAQKLGLADTTVGMRKQSVLAIPARS